MKKFMTFAALAAFAASAQAATINWGLGADVYLMEDGADYTTAKIAYESSLVPDASSYLALVYVGQGVDSFNIGDITAASVVASTAYVLDTDGSTYAAWDPDPVVTDVTDTTTYPNGASFGVVWFNGDSFDYVYSIDDGSALNDAVTFSDMVRGNDWVLAAGMTAGYGGIITVPASTPPTPPVPEPSVALMGLLGLGMMLKRRRA